MTKICLIQFQQHWIGRDTILKRDRGRKLEEILQKLVRESEKKQLHINYKIT